MVFSQLSTIATQQAIPVISHLQLGMLAITVVTITITIQCKQLGTIGSWVEWNGMNPLIPVSQRNERNDVISPILPHQIFAQHYCPQRYAPSSPIIPRNEIHNGLALPFSVVVYVFMIVQYVIVQFGLVSITIAFTSLFVSPYNEIDTIISPVSVSCSR